MAQNSVAAELQSSERANNYFFQIALKRLTFKGSKGQLLNEFFFTISKGRQIFQFTKPYTAEWPKSGVLDLVSQRLNFVVLRYNPQRLQQFSVRINKPSSDEDEYVAEYFLDCNNYIEHFLKTKNGAFQQKMILGENFVLETEIYVQKSRYKIQHLVREILKKKEGEQSLSLQSVEERAKDEKIKGRSLPRQNPFRRTPSPTRKQIKEIIARRKSPVRETPGKNQTLLKVIEGGEDEKAYNISGSSSKQKQGIPQKIEEQSHETRQEPAEAKQNSKEETAKQKQNIEKTEAVVAAENAQKTQQSPEQIKPIQEVSSYMQKVYSNPKLLIPLIVIVLLLILSYWPSSSPGKQKISKQKVKAAQPQPKQVKVSKAKTTQSKKLKK